MTTDHFILTFGKVHYEYWTTGDRYYEKVHCYDGVSHKAKRISEDEYQDAVETAYEQYAWNGGMRSVDC